jgi:hypothetical protein
MAVAKQFGRNKKQLGGVERAVLPDQPFVSVIVSHVVRRQQHHVVSCSIQLAVCPILDASLRKNHAALGAEVGDHKLVLLRFGRFGIFGVFILREGANRRRQT